MAREFIANNDAIAQRLPLHSCQAVPLPEAMSGEGLPVAVLTGEGGDELFAGESSATTDLWATGRFSAARRLGRSMKALYTNDLWYPPSLFSKRKLLLPKGRYKTWGGRLKRVVWLTEKADRAYRKALADSYGRSAVILPGSYSRHEMLRRVNYLRHSLFLKEYEQQYVKQEMRVFHPMLDIKLLSLSYSIRREHFFLDGSFKGLLKLAINHAAPSTVVGQTTKNTHADIYGDMVDLLDGEGEGMQNWHLARDGIIDVQGFKSYVSAEPMRRWRYSTLLAHEKLYRAIGCNLAF